MKVTIYVEGPSDRIAMSKLFQELIECKQQEGITIAFFETPAGDRKESLLVKLPKKAVNILINEPNTFVAALPDLYPKNKGFPHSTYLELERGLEENFKKELRLMSRFKVFCFKHDLEALILAAEEGLQARFPGKKLRVSWIKPVEDQNHDRPPKRIVEEIYLQQGQKYIDTVDAPLILGQASYSSLAERCQQCFKPFVDFLENLQALDS